MNWPYFHMIINHFPIILGVMGAAAAVLGLLVPRRGVWLYALASLTLAALSAYPAVFTGERAEHVLEEAWYGTCRRAPSRSTRSRASSRSGSSSRPGSSRRGRSGGR